jgi:predicted glycoside hydrolase/deacetylase ChbG (UPF0249 family)
MSGKRYLIVNADDFGLSRGVNRGIVKAYEIGIVTSASLMVRPSSASEAAAYGRKNPGLCLGLHVDLGEWAYRNGQWVPLYEVVPIKDHQAVKDEAYRQLDVFRRMLGQDPTHIDSHQHVHLRESVGSILFKIAMEIGVPLRHHSQEIRFRGDFYGQTEDGKPNMSGIDETRLLQILENLAPGMTELSCHPAEGDDVTTMYRTEREIELNTLCNPKIRSAIKKKNIQLCSYRDIAGILPGTDRRY